MQARSSVDGQMKVWSSSSADWAGVGFPGPGTPQHVAVLGRYVAPGAFVPAGSNRALQFNDDGELGGAVHAEYVAAAGGQGAKLRLRSASATTGGTSFEIVDSAGNVVANMTFAEAADPNDFFTSFAGAGLFQIDAFDGTLELKGEQGVRARSPVYQATVVPDVFDEWASLANAGELQSTFNPTALSEEEFPSGYYQAAVTVLAKRAGAGDYRCVRLAFDFILDRTADTVTVIGTPTPIDGAWDSTGLTVEVDTAAADTLRITTTNGTGQTTSGRILWSRGRQPLL